MALGFYSAGTAYLGFGGGLFADPKASFGPVSLTLAVVFSAGVGSSFLFRGGGRAFFSSGM